MAVNNIIFDIGNVLLRWEPDKIYTTLFNRKDFYRHPLSEIVGGPIWLDLDQGLLEFEEGIEKAVKGNEVFKEDIEMFFRNAPNHFYPIQSTVDIAMGLKEEGKRIYLLSNFHKYGYGILKKRFPFFDTFDGGVISWDVKLNKPDRRIYEIILSRYNLNPKETVFIDDTVENITAAEKLGIRGICYRDNTDLFSELKHIME